MNRVSKTILLGAIAFAMPALAEGPGVRAGAMEIHPSVFVEGGFDNNVFYDSVDDVGSPNSASLLRAGGGVDIENMRSNNVNFRLGGNFVYRHLASIDDPESRLSDEAVEARNGIANAKAYGMLAILPRSSVTLELHEDFRYTERPGYETSVAGFEKIANKVGPDLRFRPGSGALELRLGYRFQLTQFLDASSLGAGAERASNESHDIRLLTHWRWLPKTALLLDMRYRAINYARPEEFLGQGQNAQSADRDSTPFRIETGIKGLLSKRISVVLLAGYLNTFNVVGESFVGFVGKAELRYRIEPTVNFGVGYERDGSDSFFSNFYSLNRFYADAELHFFSKVSLGGRLAFDDISYSANGAPGGVARTDPVLRTRVFARYNFTEWFNATLDWRLDQNDTEYASPVNEPNAAQRDFASYSRQLVMARLSIDY
jgi:hypothetical protein